MKPLRDYQIAATERVRNHWRGCAQSVLLISPTGTGKTTMGAHLVGSARTIWAAHTRELVEQAAAELRRLYGWRNVATVVDGRTEDAARRIQVGTTQTLLARIDFMSGFDAELLVVDEAHHYRAEQWEALLGRVTGRIVGLTATPERRDKQRLATLFEAHVIAIQRSEAIARNLLVPTRLLQPDITKPINDDLVMSPVDAWARCAEGAKAIVYCRTVDAAERFCRQFDAHGINARVISGGTPRSERDRTMADFRADKLRVLLNVHGSVGPRMAAALAIMKTPKILRRIGRISRRARAKKRVELAPLSEALAEWNPSA